MTDEVNGVPLTRSVGALVTLAESRGWTAIILADRGQWKGKDLSLVVVSLRRGSEGAVAQWANGKADSCWRWPVEGHFLGRQKITYRQLRELL